MKFDQAYNSYSQSVKYTELEGQSPEMIDSVVKSFSTVVTQ